MEPGPCLRGRLLLRDERELGIELRVASIEDGSKRARAASIGGLRGVSAVCSKRKELTVYARGLHARRAPLGDHLIDFRAAHPPRILAHRARRIELPQLGRMLSIL